MGVVRSKNNVNFYDTKRLVIQFDTLCSTGCDYCFLSSIKSNPIKYDIEKLSSFLNTYSPEAVTLYGADTFINFNLYKSLLNKIVNYKSIKLLSNVTELIKLKRDYNNITHVYEICKKHNILYKLTFSMDLVGKKYSTDFESIVKLSNVVGINNFLLNIIITKDTIDEIYNNIESIVNNINLSYENVKRYIILNYRLAINFEAVELPIDNFEEKCKKIFTELNKCNIKNIINGDEDFKTFGCEARDLNGVFIDLNGDIVACGKMLPEYEVPEKISALNFVPTDMTKVDNLLLDFKKYNNNIIMDKCNNCKAKFICAPCPKTIKMSHENLFNKDLNICQFYKTQYETYKELNNKYYRIIKNILKIFKFIKL